MGVLPGRPSQLGVFPGLSGLPLFPVMVAFSNVCFLSALLLVLRETADEFGEAAARVTVAILRVMPGSYVFSSAYTESLFLLAVVATLALVRRRLWLPAGVAAALAALTRNTGIGLVLPMLLVGTTDFLSTRHEGQDLFGRFVCRRSEILRVAIAISIPVMALLGFCIFLYFRAGDPVAFLSIQEAWRGRLRWSPLATLAIAITDPESFVAKDALNWLFALLSVSLLFPLALWRRWPLLVLGIFLVVVPLSFGLTSFVRFATTMLPATMAAGTLCAGRPTVAVVLLTALAALNGFMMVGWALGVEFVI